MLEGYEALEAEIEKLAVMSVGRGCFFAALAIWCAMIGLIYDPVLSLKSGGILTLLVAAVLLLKALGVTRRSYKKTEIWILLGRHTDLLPQHAQRLITTILRDTYLRYALYAGAMGILFLALSAFFGIGRAG